MIPLGGHKPQRKMFAYGRHTIDRIFNLMKGIYKFTPREGSWGKKSNEQPCKGNMILVKGLYKVNSSLLGMTQGGGLEVPRIFNTYEVLIIKAIFNIY
jgi:hypothetical protein